MIKVKQTNPQYPKKSKDNESSRNLKVIKSSFATQFNLSKLLVVAVLAILILLGPTILLISNNIEQRQELRLNLLVGQITTFKQKFGSTTSQQGMPSFTPKEIINIVNGLHHAGINDLKNFQLNDTVINNLIKELDSNQLFSDLLGKINIDKSSLKFSTIEGLSFLSLAQVFSTAILYALAWGIFSALKDKSLIDKNRVMYMNYSKNSILFWKIVAETAMFLFIVLISDSIGIILVSTIGKGQISSSLLKQLAIQLIAMVVFYFFIQVGIRLITSKIQSKTIKGIVLAAWLLSTAFLYLILSIIFGVDPTVTNVIISNKYVFIFMPIVNIVILPLVLYGTLPLWAIIPFIAYAIITIALIWKKLTPAVKEYLCS